MVGLRRGKRGEYSPTTWEAAAEPRRAALSDRAVIRITNAETGSCVLKYSNSHSTLLSVLKYAAYGAFSLSLIVLRLTAFCDSHHTHRSLAHRIIRSCVVDIWSDRYSWWGVSWQKDAFR
jgi:hypothetical protein